MPNSLRYSSNNDSINLGLKLLAAFYSFEALMEITYKHHLMQLQFYMIYLSLSLTHTI